MRMINSSEDIAHMRLNGSRNSFQRDVMVFGLAPESIPLKSCLGASHKKERKSNASYF
jgi:hypothetical protein